MRTILLLVLSIALAVWAYILRQRLMTAQQRSTMYHDIAVRLDQRVAALEQEQP